MTESVQIQILSESYKVWLGTDWIYFDPMKSHRGCFKTGYTLNNDRVLRKNLMFSGFWIHSVRVIECLEILLNRAHGIVFVTRTRVFGNIPRIVSFFVILIYIVWEIVLFQKRKLRFSSPIRRQMKILFLLMWILLDESNVWVYLLELIKILIFSIEEFNFFLNSNKCIVIYSRMFCISILNYFITHRNDIK